MNERLQTHIIHATVPEAKLSCGLIYVPCLETGITRREGKRGFLYYTADGRRIADKNEIARLNALAIPPACRDVLISSNPLSHLQAVGIDARGRKQYRYHADWRGRHAWRFRSSLLRKFLAVCRT